ncbi:MAG: PilZ domain-containing protein [Planctomycetaceae bacterium]
MSIPEFSQAAASQGAAHERDRRRHNRHPGRAMAEVIRATDPLRQGSRVELLDVSLSGIGFLTGTALQMGERVTVRLQNVVQRFNKEIRGIVRWVMPFEDGTWRVGVELSSSFTPLEMQHLKRAGLDASTGSARSWI